MAVQGAGLLAMDGQEAGMTPFPGLDHSGPRLGWGIFPLPRGQEEETRGHTPSRPAASFALRPAALSLGLLPHVHGPHPAQLLGSPDFGGVCSLPEDWLLCLPGPQACLGEGSHAACCVAWGGRASCASVPQAGELTPVLPPTLTGASLSAGHRPGCLPPRILVAHISAQDPGARG